LIRKPVDGEIVMEKRNRYGIITFCLLVALVQFIGLIAACKGKTQEEAVKRPVVDRVTVTAITPSTVDEIYETTGTVRSDRTSIVASRAMGVVISLLVQEGDIVKTGQLLLTLDDRDIARRSQAAAMALESAKQNNMFMEATWRRYKNLYDEKALSRQEMDQIETQKKVSQSEYERMKAMADEARIYQSFTRVKAPVSGRVTQKHIDVGSMANPGMPLLSIEENSSSYVEVSVDERLRNKIKPGMYSEIRLDGAGEQQRGIIRQVLPSIDSLSRTFIVKIGFKDMPSRSGLFVRVRIPVGKKEIILVPEKAIVQKGQLTGVYLVDDRGVVTYRLIRTGITYADGTEIISGLTVGDRIITEGIEQAKDGGIITGGKVQ
jgi:RND family efflux transporter MFP subunit